MDTGPPTGIRGWWAKYRRWLIVLLAAYVLFVLLLILFSGGLQHEPFLYQLF
jgi:hypothetical protein